MNRIQLLSDQVANQIAAGEVVQRPVNVVKELVENALDAGARRLEVEYQAGGRSLIRVSDDGAGMSRDDALLCLERHATSKINAADDLGKITSFGFRGEALSSIASVSRFTLTTRERDSQNEAATQVVVKGGKVADVREAGHPAGTSIEVRDLFFNVPARKKFLRTIETEKGHIQHYLTLVALAHPEVALTCIQDKRPILQLAAAAQPERLTDESHALLQRWRSLSGSEKRVIPVDFEAALPPGVNRITGAPLPGSTIRLRGLIGAPGVSRGSRQDLHLFVNRRPVESRALRQALQEGYHTMLMKGRHPVGCLFLEIDPAEVDVNIHPAKREIKFHLEKIVQERVAEAIRQTLHDSHARAGNSASPPAAPSKRIPVPERAARVLPSAFQKDLPASPAPLEKKPDSSPTGAPGDAPKDRKEPVPQAEASEFPGESQPAPSESSAGSSPEDSSPGLSLNVPLRLLGIVGRIYAVLESDRGLVLMDQRAAHERVLYEQMLERLEKDQSASQKLLLPETIELSAKDAQFLREHLRPLNRLGLGLSEFGSHTFLLDALPPSIRANDARRFVVELIDELRESCQAAHARKLTDYAIAKSISRKAVSSCAPLAEREVEKLIEDLRRCAMPYTSPHGRPTMIEMSLRELERKFGRIP